MFNRITVAAAALSIAAIMPATSSAQDYQRLRQASIEIYNTCLASAGDIASPEGCACTAGFVGGALTEREFDIAARLARIGALVENGATDAEIQTEVNAFSQAGFTSEDADYVAAKLQLVAARGDAICSPYENAAPTS